MSKNPVPLFSHHGSSQFPRVIIHDGQRYWTGETWSDDAKDAQLFFDTNMATEVVDQIYREMAKDKAVEQVVRVPMELLVHSDEGVDLKTLQDWLLNSVKISINRHECGNGPGDSLVVIGFKVGEIEEVTS